MSVLCAIDFDQSTNLFAKESVTFNTTVSDTVNCTANVISSLTDTKVFTMVIEVTTTASIELCQFNVNSVEFTGITSSSVSTNKPQNIKDMSAVLNSPGVLEIQFSTFTTESARLYVKIMS